MTEKFRDTLRGWGFTVSDDCVFLGEKFIGWILCENGVCIRPRLYDSKPFSEVLPELLAISVGA